MDVHKDCYSAINLTRQGGPYRRETNKPSEDQIRKRAQEIGKRTTGRMEGTMSSGIRPSGSCSAPRTAKSRQRKLPRTSRTNGKAVRLVGLPGALQAGHVRREQAGHVRRELDEDGHRADRLHFRAARLVSPVKRNLACLMRARPQEKNK
jgi:hypothetical protein